MTAGYFKELIRARSRTLVLLLLLLLLNIALVLFSRSYLQPKLQSQQNEWFSKRKVAGSVLDRGSAYDKGSADHAKWRAAIPPKKDLARVVGEIYETARSNSLQIGTVTYKPEQIKTENLLVYVLGFSVSGKYASVKSFIADIGRFRDIVTIDNITLSNSKMTEENVSLNISVSLFFKLEGQ